MDLMADLGLPSVRERFLEILAEAKSNLAEIGTGADIFRRLVERARIGERPADALRAIQRSRGAAKDLKPMA
jgi:hypothetical protein